MEERDAIEHNGESIPDKSRQPTVSVTRDRKQPDRGPRYHAVATDAAGAKSLHALAAYGDDEAIALALSLADGHPVEVWDGPRLVERFNAGTR